MLNPSQMTTQTLKENIRLYLNESEALSPEDIRRLRSYQVELSTRPDDREVQWSRPACATEHEVSRTYTHIASDGTHTEISVENGGERYYYLPRGRTYLPSMPNSVAGRYTAERIASGDYTPQQIHDDYMLEGAYQPPKPAEPAYLAQADEIADQILARLDDNPLVARDRLRTLLVATARVALLTERSN